MQEDQKHTSAEEMKEEQKHTSAEEMKEIIDGLLMKNQNLNVMISAQHKRILILQRSSQKYKFKSEALLEIVNDLISSKKEETTYSIEFPEDENATE